MVSTQQSDAKAMDEVTAQRDRYVNGNAPVSTLVLIGATPAFKNSPCVSGDVLRLLYASTPVPGVVVSVAGQARHIRDFHPQCRTCHFCPSLVPIAVAPQQTSVDGDDGGVAGPSSYNSSRVSSASSSSSSRGGRGGRQGAGSAAGRPARGGPKKAVSVAAPVVIGGTKSEASSSSQESRTSVLKPGKNRLVVCTKALGETMTFIGRSFPSASQTYFMGEQLPRLGSHRKPSRVSWSPADKPEETHADPTADTDLRERLSQLEKRTAEAQIGDKRACEESVLEVACERAREFIRKALLRCSISSSHSLPRTKAALERSLGKSTSLVHSTISHKDAIEVARRLRDFGLFTVCEDCLRISFAEPKEFWSAAQEALKPKEELLTIAVNWLLSHQKKEALRFLSDLEFGLTSLQVTKAVDPYDVVASLLKEGTLVKAKNPEGELEYCGIEQHDSLSRDPSPPSPVFQGLVPPPVSSNSLTMLPAFGFNPSLANEVSKILPNLTPFQCCILPVMVTPNNVLLTGERGSGKSTSLIIVAMQEALRQAQMCQTVLFVVPTRELAIALMATAGPLARNVGVSCGLCIGGQSVGGSMAEAAKQVVFGTLGRLTDLISRGVIQPSYLRLVIIDECPTLLEGTGRAELSTFIDQVMGSARIIMASPKELNWLPRLNKPIALLDQNSLKDQGMPITNEQPEVYEVDASSADSAFTALVEKLDQLDFGQCVIYCDSRTAVDYLQEKLSQANFPAVSLHSNLTQDTREEVLAKLMDSSLRLLITTRHTLDGIYPPMLDLVIYFPGLDSPMAAQPCSRVLAFNF